MDWKLVSRGLGLFSLALGAAEILAAPRIARALSSEGHEGLIRGVGGREILAGIGILGAPAHSARVWNRVAGDGADLAALGGAVQRDPDNRTIWAAVAFVLGATALDILTARGLDRATGKTLPLDAGAQPAAA